MVPEDKEGNKTGSNVKARCKIDIGICANVVPYSILRSLCLAMLDSTGNILKKLDSEWTNLTAYGSATIKQFGVRLI